MQTTNRFLDDIAKLAMGLLSVGKGLKDGLKERALSRAEGCAAKLDLVTREEFEVFRDVAQQARLQSEQLDARVTKLEKRR